ncbi:adenylyl-sulfate kinase [Pragia fontium]|uniref:Adenylyl-sulfate kinase n=1 Tax=Pragia fontium TaxID=82985 RepID=A0ABQ5LFN1_9GAMM|nr:adenylyl-sulfate kinase [Pragia fontium]AKJ41724.1 adenylylsulfate kinase [Pragia fontium]GKX62189.1 adenylyl-sulfate kinase [Pragia fontium]
MENNIVWHQHPVTRHEREKVNGHGSAVLWLTGLSGSGKSSVAGALEQALHQRGIHTYLLDGDNVRHGLCQDLGFADRDRRENIRRVGEVAGLMMDAGLLVITAFISPYRQDREDVALRLPAGHFIEVFVDTPIAVCEQRDPKGLYKKARAGEIKQFTGVDLPYEAPLKPDVHLNGTLPIAQLVEQLILMLQSRKIIAV